MRYPQEFIDKVLESSNLVEIISQHTQLKQSGGGYMGRCPFPDHKEKTPSFSVSEAKQVYHCFGCKKSGNVFSFLRDFSGFGFIETIEFLADRAGLKLPEPEYSDADRARTGTDHYDQENRRKKSILQANRVAADFFISNLKKSRESDLPNQYVKRRGLSSETIQEFEIGTSTPEWDSLVHELQRAKISFDIAEEAKLIRPRKEGNGHYDLFRERLMFPIHSLRGDVVGFGGRIYDQGEPKYLNSPESAVFHKSKILYGLYQSAKYVRSEDSIVIVEGYMDMVSLYQSGIKNCAATMGTALTEEHAKLIKRMTTNVYVLFDSDQAGQAAAERSLGILLNYGLFPKGIILDKAKDPDEYVKKFGADALRQVMASSPDLFKVILRQWLQGYTGESSQKVKMIDQLSPLFSTMADGRLAELYKQEVAERLDVSFEWLNTALRQTEKSRRAGPGAPNSMGSSSLGPGVALNSSAGQKPANSEIEAGLAAQLGDNSPQNEPIRQKIRLSNASKAEKMMLALVLKSRANMEFFIEKIQDKEGSEVGMKTEEISHLATRQIIEKAEQVYRQDLDKFDKLFSLLIDKIDEPQLLFVAVNEELEHKLIADAVKKVRQEFVKTKMAQVKGGIKGRMDVPNDLQGDLELARKLKEVETLQRNRLGLKK